MDIDGLFSEHKDHLVRYLTRLTGDPELAQDAAQESFLRMLRRPPERQDNLKAWLFTVATNVVRDDWKRRASADRSAGPVGQAVLADAPPDPHAQLEQSELRKTVQQILSKLTERERTILLMREEGFLHREIAEAVGTTTQSVGTLIARALRKLASELGPVAGTLS
jgi:RNA polymerase sigma-70 factor (ECF subfamily)